MINNSDLNNQENSEKNQETPSELSSIHHSFDTKLAAKYGIEEAIIIHHMQYWIRFNKNRGKNEIEGRTWTRQTRADIKAHFPYMTYETVKHVCETLVEKKVLIAEKFSRNPIDNTLSYAFVDEKAFGIEEFSKNVYERENSLSKGKIPSPIEDTKHKDTLKKEIPLKGDKERNDADASAAAKAAPPQKKKKPDKVKYLDHVFLTEEEHVKLVKKFGDSETKHKIEKLNAYVGSKNKHYASHYHTILAWHLTDEEKAKEKALADKKEKPVKPSGVHVRVPKWMQDEIDKEKLEKEKKNE